MQPIAFLTYCLWPCELTAHDLSHIRQQGTFVVDQGFGVGGRGAWCVRGGTIRAIYTRKCGTSSHDPLPATAHKPLNGAGSTKQFQRTNELSPSNKQC